MTVFWSYRSSMMLRTSVIFRPRLKSAGLQIQMGCSASAQMRGNCHACVPTTTPAAKHAPVRWYSFKNFVYSVGRMKPCG